MTFKTPRFWYRPANSPAPLLEKILTPLSRLYQVGYEWHQRSGKPEKFNVPIVCVGNINAGGTGKTPTALAFMELIRDHNLARQPFFLLRGYGGEEEGPLQVDPARHNFQNVGDEALILAAQAPTIISGDRAKGTRLAASKNADLIVMDDGLQNPGIHKTLKIVVINGDMGFGNGKMLPAGPLREPLDKGLARADIFVLIGEDKRGVTALLPTDKPIIRARLETDDRGGLPPSDKKYVAFAGLGYPDKFFNFVKDKINLSIVQSIHFPDHHPYTEQNLKHLQECAQAYNASLLTTKKDKLRLPAMPGLEVFTADVRLVWDNEKELIDFLKFRLSPAQLAAA